MTRTEIEMKLQKDAIFALNFAIDNNPFGIITSARDNGIPIPLNAPRNMIYDYMIGVLNGNKNLAIKIVSETPYNKDATNYTAGFIDYFMSTQPAETVTANMRFTLDGLLAGLGAGLSTYSAVNLASLQAENGVIDPVRAAEEEAKRKAEEEAKKKKQMYWIIGGVVGVVILGVIVYFATKK